MLLHALPFSNK